MKEALDKYSELLYNLFLYDVEVFSQGWIYAWILIPAACYFMFFCAKWVVLTLPIWLPFRIIFNSLTKLIKVAKKTRKSK